MTCLSIVSGESLRRRIQQNISAALRAAIGSIGPNGRSVVYAQGSTVKRASNAIEIIRHITGDSAEETLLRETFYSAHQTFNDGTARLAAMFEGALTAANDLLALGMHPTPLQRTVKSLLPELEQRFAEVTIGYTSPDPLLRAFDLPAEVLPVIKKALNAAGRYGHIDVSTRHRSGIECVNIKGFFADMQPLTEVPHVAMSEVYVLVINELLHDQPRLLSILEGFAKSSKSLVIAARGLDSAVKRLLEVNRAAGVLNVAVFEPEQKGPRARAILADLAVATGATLVCEELGHSVATLTPNMLGRASGYDYRGGRLIFSHPQGDSASVAQRRNEIAEEIDASRYLELDRENAIRRYARLTGNWVEIAVGESESPPDLRDRLARVCSAIAMAQTSGVIAGGGVGLAQVADCLNAHATACPTDRAARYMLTRALQAPQQALRQNARHDDPGEALADPAGLSRTLTQIALSLALQFMAIDTAVLRS